MSQLEAIIGLEVHAQMNTKTKMFCGCDNDAFGKEPNTTVCEICMGHPGTLPVPNREAIIKAVKMSLALKCTVNRDSHFDRKHYFYPDLPSGFQISQYDFPLASHGEVEFDLRSSDSSVSSAPSVSSRRCRITRLHMENDAGKLTHRGSVTLCDYNRAGTPLMEIVTEPDLRSADEAVTFAEELRRILIAVNASEADMFKGMMRFDASISLREKGTAKLNPRSEIKNLNSFKALERALQYEEARLRKSWDETGGPLKGDITVGWMDDEGKTRLLREKETADDYRYFPEPDIPPLLIDEKMLLKIQPEPVVLPRERKKHYLAMGLNDSEAATLIDQPAMRGLFDAVHAKTDDIKWTRSLVLTQIAGFINKEKRKNRPTDEMDFKIVLEQTIAIIDKVNEGIIDKNQAKDFLDTIVQKGGTIDHLIDTKGIRKVDDSEIEYWVDQAITENSKAVEDFNSGKKSALGAIVGWVMKKSEGKANPVKVNEILMKKMKN